MGANSKIEWTDDTISFWWGCTRYGEGCRHCYAEKLSKRFGDFWGPQSPRLWIKSAVAECERLNRQAEREGKQRLVFVNSMSDFFEQHDGQIVSREGNRLYNFEGYYKVVEPAANVESMNPTTLDDSRREAFKTFERCNWLQFLLLTKRAENIPLLWEPADGIIRRNVWLGTSIATQADADRNIPLLRKCRDLAPILFLSCEPLIEAVELDLTGIDWVVVGCESNGRKAGRFQHGYESAAHSINQQCKAAGVAVFNKQMPIGGTVSHDPNEWPDDLKARTFPTGLGGLLQESDSDEGGNEGVERHGPRIVRWGAEKPC